MSLIPSSVAMASRYRRRRHGEKVSRDHNDRDETRGQNCVTPRRGCFAMNTAVAGSPAKNRGPHQVRLRLIFGTAMRASSAAVSLSERHWIDTILAFSLSS